MNRELVTFVPKLALSFPGGAEEIPSKRAVLGCVLFADLSGFTFLANKLEAEGPEGAEKVQVLLNRVFEPLTDLVHASNGEIVSFPGDAAIATWISHDENELAKLALVAANTGLRIQKALSEVEAVSGFQPHLKMALCSGSLSLINIGDREGSRFFLFDGEPLHNISPLLEFARPGEILCSEDVRAFLNDNADIESRDGFHLLKSCNTAAVTLPEIAVDDYSFAAAYVPQTVLSLIDAEQLNWVAEYRYVTSIFVNISRPESGPAQLDRLNDMGRVIQKAVARFDGAINQIVIDDKGLVVVVAFGTLNFVHEDDASRAIFTSTELHRALTAMGYECKVGIATGKVFVGKRGSQSRHELALIGHSVNLAARLMQIAEDVLCDSVTRNYARKRFYFEAPAPVLLKGVAEEVPVFRPQGTKDSGYSHVTILGRSAECELIDQSIDRLENSGQGGLLVIKGNPGIGKSEMMNYVAERSLSSSIKVLKGVADSIESSSPFYALRPVIHGLLGISSSAPSNVIMSRVQSLFPEDAEFKVALLAPVLSVTLPENKLVNEMTPQGRAAAVSEVLIDLVRMNLNKSSLLIMVEDVHWLDGASSNFLETLLASISQVLVVVSTRPTDRLLFEMANTDARQLLEINELDRADATTLLCRSLDVDSVPEEIAEYVFERSGGQPLFTQQLARALRNHSSIQIKNGECNLINSANLENLDLPYDITGVISSTLDALSLKQQLVLKVASVFGLTFSFDDLLSALVNEFDEKTVLENLRAIEAAGLIVQLGVEYRFKHALIQLTVYDILPAPKRMELHLLIGEKLEQRNANDTTRVCALLGHHFIKGGNFEKAITYMEIAGHNALKRDYANDDAVKIFQRLIEIDENAIKATRQRKMKLPFGARTDARSARRADWYRLLGDALMRTSGMGAEECFTQALRLLGHSYPMSRAQVLRIILFSMLRCMLFTPRYPVLKVSGEAEKNAVEATIAAFERHARLTYTQGRPLDGIACSFKALPYAESIGPSFEFCNSYSMMSNVIALTGRLKLANHYRELAVKVAKDIGNRAAQAHADSRAVLYRMQHADQTLIPYFENAANIFSELHDYHEASMANLMLARTLMVAGDYEKPQALCELAMIQSKRGQSLHSNSWAVATLAEVMYRKGLLDKAQRYCMQAEEILISHGSDIDHVTYFQNEGTLALIALRNKQPHEAWKHAQKSLHAHDSGGWLTFSATSGYMGILETLLYSLENNSLDIAEAEKIVNRLLRKIKWSKSRWVVIPLYYYYNAKRNVQLNKIEVAEKSLETGIAMVRKMQMPFELGLMLNEYGNITHDATKKSTLLDEAVQVFKRIDAREELKNIHRSGAA